MDPPAELDEQQQAAWLKDKQFLHQLMDNTKVSVCTSVRGCRAQLLVPLVQPQIW